MVDSKYGGTSGLLVYFSRRITPTPIFFRSLSAYFSCAFSACILVLYGLDSGVNSPSMYLNSSHCFVALGMVDLTVEQAEAQPIFAASTASAITLIASVSVAAKQSQFACPRNARNALQGR